MGPDDLVLCSGTLPRGVPYAERLAAASNAGFTAISLWGRDYRAARAEGLTDHDLRSMLDDHGLVVAEVDPAWWWPPGAADIRVDPRHDTEEVFRFGEDELFAVADAVNARSCNAVDIFGGSWDIDAAAEAFAGLCRRAAEHGLLIHLEWLPWSKIADLATALQIVRRAAAPNGGINVDAWHLVRSGTQLDALAGVPGDLILGIQLSDGPAVAEENLVEATLRHRLLPGEGEFDLTGLIRTLAATGTTAPMGVEVFNDGLQAHSAAEAALLAGQSTRRVLDAAR